MAAGIAFTVSWMIGLALPVPNLAVNAPAPEVLARYGGHLAMVQTQFALIEGRPVVGLALVAVALTLVVWRSGWLRPGVGGVVGPGGHG